MKLRPLHDRVLLKRSESADKTAGGLYIPDSAKEKPLEAEVVAVGKGRLREDGSIQAMEVAVGNLVLFGKYAGTEVKVDGESYTLLREEEILAILER